MLTISLTAVAELTIDDNDQIAVETAILPQLDDGKAICPLSGAAVNFNTPGSSAIRRRTVLGETCQRLASSATV
jgi:hypothetical protein